MKSNPFFRTHFCCFLWCFEMLNVGRDTISDNRGNVLQSFVVMFFFSIHFQFIRVPVYDGGELVKLIGLLPTFIAIFSYSIAQFPRSYVLIKFIHVKCQAKPQNSDSTKNLILHNNSCNFVIMNLNKLQKVVMFKITGGRIHRPGGVHYA